MMGNKAALVRIFEPVVPGKWFLLQLISTTCTYSYTHAANAALILVFILMLSICFVCREPCSRLINRSCVQFSLVVTDTEGRGRDERERES